MVASEILEIIYSIYNFQIDTMTTIKVLSYSMSY